MQFRHWKVIAVNWLKTSWCTTGDTCFWEISTLTLQHFKVGSAWQVSSREDFINNSLFWGIVIQYHLIIIHSQPGNQGIIREFEKWTLFYRKIRGLSGNFDWISGKSWKINRFQEKYFLMIKFLSFLLSVMHMFMFWNIFLLFLAMSILFQPVFMCLKIWVLKYSMLDCCMMHHNCMDFYLIEVTNLHGYQKQQFWEVNFCNVIL